MNSNNNLDKYFQQARKVSNTENFFSEDEIRSITEKGYKGEQIIPKNYILKILKRNKVMTISLLTLISTFLWLSFSETNNVNQQTTDSKQQTVNNQKVKKSSLSTDQLTPQTDNGKQITDKTDDFNHDALLQNPDAYPLLKLTDNELEKIGMKRKGQNYQFIVEHTMVDKSYGPFFDEVIDAGYKADDNEILVRTKYIIDTNGIKTEVIPKQGFTINKASKIVPYGYMTNNYSQYINLYGDMGRGVFFLNPLFQDRYKGSIGYELKTYMDNNWAFRDYSMNKKNNIILSQSEYPVLRKLIPVFTHNGPKNSGADVIYWYLPTKEFMDALPDRYRDIVSKKYMPIEKFIFTEDMKHFNQNDNKDKAKLSFSLKKNWGGITFIFYPDDEWVSSLDKAKKAKLNNETIQLEIDDLRKIRNNLKKSIMKYNPPSQDILTYENDSAKFENLLHKAIDKAAGNQKEVKKVQLYGVVCRLFAYDIKGIEEIELDDKELAELNVFSDSLGYYTFVDVKYNIEAEPMPESRLVLNSLPHKNIFDRYGPNKKIMAENGWDTTKLKGYYRKNIEMNRITYREKILEYQGWDINETLKIQPVAVSHIQIVEEKSTKTSSEIKSFASAVVFYNSPVLIKNDSIFNRFQWDKNIIESKFNKLIPVIIVFYNQIEEDSLKWIQGEYTLWYILNNDLIKALPERYRKSLSKELELLTAIDDGSIQPETACEQIKSEQSYLDLCRFESASLRDINIFPNPVTKQKVNVKFNLLKSCKVRIDIHELSGKFIGNLFNDTLKNGEQTLDLSLSNNIQKGIYLISITNNKGEQVVRKLFVE